MLVVRVLRLIDQLSYRIEFTIEHTFWMERSIYDPKIAVLDLGQKGFKFLQVLKDNTVCIFA